MIGRNELILNKATLKQALQKWLDARMVKSDQEVLDVKYDPCDDLMTVTIVSKEDGDGNQS